MQDPNAYLNVATVRPQWRDRIPIVLLQGHEEILRILGAAPNMSEMNLATVTVTST